MIKLLPKLQKMMTLKLYSNDYNKYKRIERIVKKLHTRIDKKIISAISG